jgi:hypothetical protein
MFAMPIRALTEPPNGSKFRIVSESLVDFLKSHPFWAILIIAFMILPIVGAVLHILLKAFSGRGIDNEPNLPDSPAMDDSGNGLPDDNNLDAKNYKVKRG